METILLEAIERWRQWGFTDDDILSMAYQLRDEQKGECICALFANGKERT